MPIALYVEGEVLQCFVFGYRASTNIVHSTLARVTYNASRSDSAGCVRDSMTARDWELGHGVSPVCRLREATVNERRQSLDLAMHAVEQTADPQTEAAIKIVAWVSAGTLRPSGNDFATLRLVLLALLPQIGGILLMVGRVRIGNPKVTGAGLERIHGSTATNHAAH